MNNKISKNKKTKKNYKNSREKCKEYAKKTKTKFDKDNKSSDKSLYYNNI